VTLDREPEETAREERTVCLLCVFMCMCGKEKEKESKEGKTVGGTRDRKENSKG